MKWLRCMVIGCAFAGSASGGVIAHMQFVSDAGGSGVFIFNVDGVLTRLFCDQFLPNAMTGPYVADVATLADLSGSALALRGDAEAFQKYQKVAILNLWALMDPLLAVDVVRASRRIVDGTGPLGPDAQTLFDRVMVANPAGYDLSGFRIYSNPITQEVTGFVGGFDLVAVPEPSAMLLFGSGLAALALGGRHRRWR